MTVRARAGSERRLRYEIRNRDEVARVAYLALPVDGPDQQVMSCAVDARGGNGPVPWQRVEEIDHVGAVVSLPPGGSLRVTAVVRPIVRSALEPVPDGDGEPRLSAGQRAHFLRETALTPLTTDIVEQARATAGSGTDAERVRRLFERLTDGSYRYEWPPPDRGATGLLRTGTGDCGDFSFLFVAWCRALGVPARTVVGGWADADDAAHVWAEFHLEDAGWVPADVSVAVLLRGEPDRFAAYGVGPDPDAHFGSLIGERVVFARDVAVRLPGSVLAALRAEQTGAAPAEAAPGLVIAGRPFRWGVDTLDETAPYLQPGFIVGASGADIGWRVRRTGALGVVKRVRDVARLVFGLGGATSLAWLLLSPPAPLTLRALTAFALTVYLLSDISYRMGRRRERRR